ncbi:hypothetical protein OUZ56_031211 [Daphnia magna]|uniref:Uncharacterized protein n=1 Tax=Daphnia magna TaxID=35525 RepID=A0ABQ9ZTK9_9CRUS|nr:hypothetical protein OUZ56_031211 [Daphnia magna]
MAQRNQPDNGLGGFANPKFVLINGDFWNCREKRRYIQGHAWLNEFTFIVLQCYLQILGYIPEYEYETNQWDCDAQSYVKERKPLNECGSLEILKYMEQSCHKSKDTEEHYDSRDRKMDYSAGPVIEPPSYGTGSVIEPIFLCRVSAPPLAVL